jgi:hypothetical protein
MFDFGELIFCLGLGSIFSCEGQRTRFFSLNHPVCWFGSISAQVGASEIWVQGHFSEWPASGVRNVVCAFCELANAVCAVQRALDG